MADTKISEPPAQPLGQSSSFLNRVCDDDRQLRVNRSENDEVQEAHTASADHHGTAFWVPDLCLVNSTENTGGRLQKGC